MTREEFIGYWMHNAGIDPVRRTPFGVDQGAPYEPRIALPCQCGDQRCRGWAMVFAAHIPHHVEFSWRAPPEQPWVVWRKEGGQWRCIEGVYTRAFAAEQFASASARDLFGLFPQRYGVIAYPDPAWVPTNGGA